MSRPEADAVAATNGRRIVVSGAGSAGCVVAARLSEDPDLDVVLLEAGPDYPSFDAMPEAVRTFVARDPAYDWNYPTGKIAGPTAVDNFGVGEQEPILYPRGRVVGGSSAINGANALRPQPHEFDRWVGLGCEEWAPDLVLPTLVDLEDDDFGGPHHGRGGPLPITRAAYDELLPVNRAFIEACTRRGFTLAEDLNAPGAAGVGSLPQNRIGTTRASAAVAYLTEDVRRRSNLSIRSDVTIDRLLFDGTTVRAVVLASGEEIDGEQFILSAGALGSPAILMRSGVGPREELARHGIPVVLAAPAVGRNLVDHPMAWITYDLRPGAVTGDRWLPGQVLLACTAGVQPAATRQRDIDVHLIPRVPDSETLQVAVGLVRPYSIGRIALRSTDPHEPPEIRLGLFEHPEDLPRVVAGVRLARRLLADEPLAPLVGAERSPGPEAEDEAAIAESVLRDPGMSYAHPVGTCRMGPPGGWSVVDQRGGVHGIDALHVIDASIFPCIPAVPPNVMTMLVAERCASKLRASWIDGARDAAIGT
jgi:choline dehydrogenase